MWCKIFSSIILGTENYLTVLQRLSTHDFQPWLLTSLKILNLRPWQSVNNTQTGSNRMAWNIALYEATFRLFSHILNSFSRLYHILRFHIYWTFMYMSEWLENIYYVCIWYIYSILFMMSDPIESIIYVYVYVEWSTIIIYVVMLCGIESIGSLYVVMLCGIESIGSLIMYNLSDQPHSSFMWYWVNWITHHYLWR
jgi:hypothetical protein